MSTSADAAGALEDIDRVRARTRFARNGHWFAAVVFGVVILGAMPFYVRSTCQHVHVCHGSSGPDPLGRAFTPDLPGSLAGWSTLYWTLAIAAGFAAVIAYYHRRARCVGVQGRLWPAITVGVVVLGLFIWVNDTTYALPGDFELRGTTVLVPIAVGLIVLSLLEGSRPFMLFAGGFLALSVLSCLYDVVNLFHRLGIGGPFDNTAGALPNLILPGAYLVVGGLAFLALGGRELRIHLQPKNPAW